MTPDALATARERAAPWAGTSLRILDHRCARADVLAYQLAQIGLHGSCARFPDPVTPDVSFGGGGRDYRGQQVDGIVYARLVDHVVTSRRVGCLTYVPYVGVDLAALCVR